MVSGPFTENMVLKTPIISLVEKSCTWRYRKQNLSNNKKYLMNIEKARQLIFATMTSNTRPTKVLILLTIERTGSTWLSDAIRCHPAVQYWPAGIICKDLKLSKFRRYPMDLSNREDATETIEVSPGKWEKIPNFSASLTGELDQKIGETEIYAIEKFHPHFFQFKPFKFAKGLTRLENLGVEVKLIYVVRDPEAAITSFMNYQKRNQNWHKETTGKEVISYMQKKYKSILQVSRYYPGLTIDYADIKTNLEKTLQRVYNHLWPHANLEQKNLIVTVSKNAEELTSRLKRFQVTKSSFLGEKEGKIKGTTDEYKEFFKVNREKLDECYQTYNKIIASGQFPKQYPGTSIPSLRLLINRLFRNA